jgi:uncharacterized protein YcbX
VIIKISSCHIYPLKSGAGQRVEALELLPRGPKGDREWMLVDTQGVFITQRSRDCEKLALVETEITETGAVFSAPRKDALSVVMPAQEIPVKIWKDDVTALDAGDGAAAWFSDYLGQDCRLVRLSESPAHKRMLGAKWQVTDGHVGFADGFPLLITNDASLTALTPHFPEDESIAMTRFRPNIVLTGLAPFEEDALCRIKIGAVVLRLVKPCTRCKITTVAQETGEAPTNEPLKTLTKLRRGKAEDLAGVFFGQNAVVEHAGTIRTGDAVEILERRDMHPALAMAELKFAG